MKFPVLVLIPLIGRNASAKGPGIDPTPPRLPDPDLMEVALYGNPEGIGEQMWRFAYHSRRCTLPERRRVVDLIIKRIATTFAKQVAVNSGIREVGHLTNFLESGVIAMADLARALASYVIGDAETAVESHHVLDAIPNSAPELRQLFAQWDREASARSAELDRKLDELDAGTPTFLGKDVTIGIRSGESVDLRFDYLQARRLELARQAQALHRGFYRTMLECVEAQDRPSGAPPVDEPSAGGASWAF